MGIISRIMLPQMMKWQKEVMKEEIGMKGVDFSDGLLREEITMGNIKAEVKLVKSLAFGEWSAAFVTRTMVMSLETTKVER